MLLQDPPHRLRQGQRYKGFTCHVPPVECEDIETAILIANNLKHHPIDSTSGRWIGACIHNNRDSMVVISSYVHHSTALGLLDLGNALESLVRKYDNILIGMDSNGKHPNWGPPQTRPNSIGVNVSEVLFLHGLAPVNKWPCPPTHVNAQGTDGLDRFDCGHSHYRCGILGNC